MTDVDDCWAGDFEENEAIDLTAVDFYSWISCLGNIAGVTSVYDLVAEVVQYPDPYLDLSFVPMDNEYIFEYQPVL
ncbi:MAG: hypothetical protein KDB22_02405 [Planctomycetales bacterium]|nr:hypothetical protein [Planctomycetales bacterium]